MFWLSKSRVMKIKSYNKIKSCSKSYNANVDGKSYNANVDGTVIFNFHNSRFT